ncbi:hypothetical protein F4604DRAFT_1934145 [Suillus subluteus]|nr:hypothetical protein F4604DRAFT_1934145 [Suillus subluteus]
MPHFDEPEFTCDRFIGPKWHFAGLTKQFTASRLEMVLNQTLAMRIFGILQESTDQNAQFYGEEPSDLRTELYLLNFLLKGRVYLGDIWQIVGGHLLEAQREESLRSATGDHTNRWSIERDFMEEKRDQCQLEVSLCSQAIDHMEQRWAMPICPVAVPVTHNATSFSATTRRIVEPVVTYSAVVRNKCEAWLRRQNTGPIPPTEIALLESGSPSAGGKFDFSHLEQRTLVTSNGPSFSLQSTWVTACVQDAFDEARKVELSTQAGLMASYLDVGGCHTHHRNAQSELTFLRSKMCCAKAEAEVYTLALENSPISTYSDSDSSSSTRPTLPQHLPEEVRHYMECVDVESVNSRSDVDDLW